MVEIPYHYLWVILIKTLNNLGIPFNVALVFSQKRFFDIFKEKVWCFVDTFLSCWPMIFIVMVKSWLFADLMLLICLICCIFFAYHSAVNSLHYSLWELRINVTTNYWKKFISLSVLWKFVKNFKGEFIHKFVKNFFVQSYKKWEINVGQVNIKFWLLILVLFQRNRHRIQILQNYFDNILDNCFCLWVVKSLLIHVNETPQNQLKNVQVFSNSKSLDNFEQYFENLKEIRNVFFMILEDKIIQKSKLILVL